jgi:hypothetical protein
VHAAARTRLEQELSQLAQTASKLSDRLFFTARGVMSMARLHARADAASPGRC